MGLSSGPMSAVLPELFPTNVLYATKDGVAWVGVYLIVAAILTVIAVLLMRETKDVSLDNPVGDCRRRFVNTSGVRVKKP